jgi:hypothetical protein
VGFFVLSLLAQVPETWLRQLAVPGMARTCTSAFTLGVVTKDQNQI